LKSKTAKLLLWILLACAACSSPVTQHKGSMQPVPEVGPRELEAAYAPRRMALVIGINNFQDSQWRPLYYAEDDARDLATTLKNPSGGNFDKVTVLTGRENTTRGAIVKAIDRLSKTNTSPHDTVLVYFSTHGTLYRDSSGALRQYLVSSDTRFGDIPNSALSLFDIQSHFGKLRSRRKVLILATCHSGHGKSALDRRMNEELRHTKAGFFVKPLEIVSEASVILSACAWGETAREDKRLKHDIYTHFFIEALSKHDPNEDGAVTVSEAHDYARQKTYYFTKGQQRPTASSDIMGADPIILAGKIDKTGKPTLFSYNAEMEGVKVRVDGQPKGKLPGSVVIDPGTRRIALIRPGQEKPFFDREVKFSQGSRMEAVKLVEKRFYEDQSLGVGIAYRAFLSPDINESVYGPMLTYGIAYGQRGPWDNTRWEFALFGGSSRQTLEIHGTDRDATITRVDLEAALMWEYKRDKFRMAGGPMVGFIYFQRRSEENFVHSPQELLTGTAGISLALGWRLAKNWQPALTYRAAFVPVELNDRILGRWQHAAGLNIAYLFD